MPTSVEPVNAILSTPGASTSAAPVSPAPVTMFTTPGGRSASWITSASSSAVSGVVSAGFSTDGVAGGERGRELPRGHQHREVPRDDLAGHTDGARRATARERVLELVGPPGVVEEVRRRQRQVDVARFLDRLAAVHRSPARRTHAPAPAAAGRSGTGTSRARCRAGRLPAHPYAARAASTATVDVLRARLGDLGERLLGGRVDRGEPPPALRLDELAADEQPVAILEPDDVGRLGRGRVLPRRPAAGPVGSIRRPRAPQSIVK